MAFMGMGMNATQNIQKATNQPQKESSYKPNFGSKNAMKSQNEESKDQKSEEDPTEKLIKMKKLLDAGVINEEEFKKVRFDILGF